MPGKPWFVTFALLTWLEAAPAPAGCLREVLTVTACVEPASAMTDPDIAEMAGTPDMAGQQGAPAVYEQKLTCGRDSHRLVGQA